MIVILSVYKVKRLVSKMIAEFQFLGCEKYKIIMEHILNGTKIRK